MKNQLFLLLLLLSVQLIAQNDELSFIKTQDLSYLLSGDSIDQIIYDEYEWETTFRPEPIGYIGQAYKRLRIHYTPIAWTDFRFSFPTDLDIGASEFSPAPEFFDNGWRTYSQAWIYAADEEERKRAQAIEERKWWK